MLTGRTEASISQDQPGRVPPDRPRLERIAKSSQGFGEGGALPCEEFLYDFKRHLRAGHKQRPVLAAEDRGTRVARIPQPTTARPRGVLLRA